MASAPRWHGWGIRALGAIRARWDRWAGGQAGHGGAMAAGMEYTVGDIVKVRLMFGGRM